MSIAAPLPATSLQLQPADGPLDPGPASNDDGAGDPEVGEDSCEDCASTDGGSSGSDIEEMLADGPLPCQEQEDLDFFMAHGN